MQDCNSIFKWYLFMNLGISILISVLLAYIPIRHWKTVPAPGLALIVITFFAFIYICTRFYPILGYVYDNSIKFVNKWIRTLVARDSESIHRNVYCKHDKGRLWNNAAVGLGFWDDDSYNCITRSRGKMLRRKLKCYYPFSVESSFSFGLKPC